MLSLCMIVKNEEDYLLMKFNNTGTFQWLQIYGYKPCWSYTGEFHPSRSEHQGSRQRIYLGE